MKPEITSTDIEAFTAKDMYLAGFIGMTTGLIVGYILGGGV